MASKITQRIALEGAKEIVAAFNSIGKEGEKAFGDIKKAADNTNQSLERTGNTAKSSFGEAAGAAEKAGEAFFTSGQKLALVGSAVVAGVAALNQLARSYFAAAEAAAKFVNEQAAAATRAGQTTKNYAETIGTLRQLGLTAAEAEQAVKQFGAGIEKDLEAGRAKLKALGITFSDTEAGAKAAAEMIANLGASSGKAGSTISSAVGVMKAARAVIDQTTGALKQSPEAWANFADAVLKLKTPLEQTKALVAVFGQELGRRLAVALRGGKEAFLKEAEDFRRISGNLTDEQREKREQAAREFARAQDRLNTALQESANQSGFLAQKLFTPFLDGLTKLIVAYNKLSILPPITGGFKDLLDKVLPSDPKVVEEKLLAFTSLIGRVITEWNLLKLKWHELLASFFTGKPPGERPLVEPDASKRVEEAIRAITGKIEAGIAKLEGLKRRWQELLGSMFGGEKKPEEGTPPLSDAPGGTHQEFSGSRRRGADDPFGLGTMLESLGGTVDEIKQLFEDITTAATELGTKIAAGFAPIGEALLTPFQTAATGIQDVLGGIGSLIDATFASLSASIESAAAQVEAAIASIIASLEAAVAQAQALAAAAASAGGGGGEGSGGSGGGEFAGGGFTGLGGKYQPAGIVHRGEYVQPQNVVRQPGVRYFMESLRRSGGDLQSAIERFRGFSAGGFVNGLSPLALPGFASGGLAGGPVSNPASAFNLVLPDGRSFQVSAPVNTVREIERWATMARLSSAGRLPREG